jgi:hypothetical protein
MTRPTPPSSPEPAADVPLCVDLDGTLIYGDVSWASFAILLKANPLYLFAMPFWLLRGHAHLKQQIAARVTIDPARLAYNEIFLDYLKQQHAAGRKLILATASDMKLARLVFNHMKIFSDVVASDGKNNLRGAAKGKVLCEMFGRKQFDYAGNSSVDLAVWRDSRKAIVVNARKGLANRAAKESELGMVF